MAKHDAAFESGPEPDPLRRTGWKLGGLGIALAAGVAILLGVLPREEALEILGQGGPVETVELLGYGVAAGFVLRMPCSRPGQRGWTLLALGLLAAFEVNPGRWLEAWVEIPPAVPGDPARLNLPGLAVLGALVLGVFGGLVLRARSEIAHALRRARPEAVFAGLGVLALGLAFFLDRYHATHFSWNQGYRLTRGIAFASHVAEEELELLAPICFALAAALAGERGRLRRRDAPPETPVSSR